MPCDYCLTMVRLNVKDRPLFLKNTNVDMAFPCLAMTGRCTKCHRCATSDCGIRLPLCGDDDEEQEEEGEEEEEAAPASSRLVTSRPPP